ncbi:hypothetical protein XENTR_v10006539 [Xenopus tropicalis]|nr:hypothetical protein XENTR_v10006539 [Xenopus tropicalis]
MSFFLEVFQDECSALVVQLLVREETSSASYLFFCKLKELLYALDCRSPVFCSVQTSHRWHFHVRGSQRPSQDIKLSAIGDHIFQVGG